MIVIHLGTSQVKIKKNTDNFEISDVMPDMLFTKITRHNKNLLKLAINHIRLRLMYVMPNIHWRKQAGADLGQAQPSLSLELDAN